MLIILIVGNKMTVKNSEYPIQTKIREGLEQVTEKYVTLTHLPIFAYAMDSSIKQTSAKGIQGIGEKIVLYNSPFLQKVKEEQQISIAIESNHEIDEIIINEGSDEENRTHGAEALEQDMAGIIRLSPDMEERLIKENEKTGITEKDFLSKDFVRAVEKQQEYQWDYYQTSETLIEDFYAIDASTSLTGNKISLESLRNPDLSLQQDNSKPQILIYHTHSQEGFLDFVPGDASTTIVGAGKQLAELLRGEYGYNVIHHTGEYDIETRDYAYSYALPEIEKILAEQDSIEVIIDLHRDAAKEGTRLVTEVNGRPTAKFMFFNGLSYTNKQGNIDYLKNPYIQENLAFSFQMQVLCNEYYPGVTRRIHLKGYRYNMHLRPKSLLVEMGAQTNTREEISNAIYVLADVPDKQLSGVDR